MDKETFCTIGAALFGPSWQRPLAVALDINERAVRHYAAGSRDMPEDVPGRLRRLLRSRAATLNALARTVKA